MMEEYHSIMKNDVLDIFPRPQGKSVVTSKWIYKFKHTVNGTIEKHKTIFVASRFSQVEGIDYEETFEETFPHVARYTSIRTIISLATSMGWSKAVGSAEREREAGARARARSAYFQKSPGAKRFRERFLYNT
jgi:hypothetical protein